MEIITFMIALAPFVLLMRPLVKRWVGSLTTGFGVDCLAVVAGLGSIGLLMFALGVLQWFDPVVVWSLVGSSWISVCAMYRAALWSGACRRAQGAKCGWMRSRMIERVLLIGFAGFATLNVFGAYIPQIGNDALVYHYAMPKLFIAHGGLHYFPYNIHAVNPFNIEMLYTFGMLLQNDIVANLVNVCIGLVFAGLIYNILLDHVGRMHALLWSLIFYSLPLTMRQMSQGFVDLGVGLFAAAGLSIVFAALRQRDLHLKPVLAAGVFLGFAAGAKLFGIVTAVFASMALVVVAVSRYRARAVGYAATLVCTALLLASPWYIRSAVHTGNPVYPSFYSVFGGKHWDASINALAKERYVNSRDIASAPMGRTLTGFFLSPLLMSFPKIATYFQAEAVNHERGIASIRPEMSYLPVLFVPFGIVALCRPRWQVGRRRQLRGMSFMLMVTGLYLGFWFYCLPQVSRHLLPVHWFVYLLSSLGLKYILERGRGLLLSTASVMACAVWIVASFGIYAIYYTPKYYGATQQDKYLNHHSMHHQTVRWINEHLASDEKIAMLSELTPYYLDVPYMHLGPAFRLSEHPSAELLYQYLRDHGVTHLFVVYNDAGEYSVKNMYLNTNIDLFRSEFQSVDFRGNRQSHSRPLTQMLSDTAMTERVFRREERRILSRTPLTYGEIMHVNVYKLVPGRSS
jgi:hypothetical protein